MNTRTFFSALSIVATLFSFASCVKEEAVSAPTTVDKGPSIPEGSRIRIHFGTATQEGCLYSFSDCIWIGWGTTATNFDGRLAIEFDNGDAAGQYFGQYFPLTSDYVVDDVEAHALGIEPQIIPAGFYAVRNHSSGQATGKRMVIFDPTQGESAGNLLNPNNPQDNIGQLHNLAVQVILNDNRDAINALNGDKAAIQQLVTEKTIQFLAVAELPLNSDDQKRALALNCTRDFGNYAARLNETRLSTNDKNVLRAIFNEAASMPVGSPQELNSFINLMTEQENRLAKDASLDNPKMVLSMVSVLKNSRYFWYWKSISSPDPGTGGTTASEIPDWVWADIIALESDGVAASIIASIIVYLDHH